MPYVLLFFVIVINMIAVVVTIVDKRAAKAHRRRVPEATLLGIGALGGSIGMLITMKLIRHKTQKPKFMIGLPLILCCQLALIASIWLLSSGIISI